MAYFHKTRQLIIVSLLLIPGTIYAEKQESIRQVSEGVWTERGYWLEKEYGELQKMERCQDLLKKIDKLILERREIEDDDEKKLFLKYQVRRYQIEAKQICTSEMIKNTVWQGELLND